jgi:NADH dehydrogenase
MTNANKKLVTIFGGDGFVGLQVVQELAQLGYRIRVAVRRPDLADRTKPLGNVGQVQPVQANIRNYASVERAVSGADIVINLVGIKHQSGKQTFEAVHIEGAANIAKAATNAGAKILVHMSALGADKNSLSISSKSKAQGEEEVLKAFPKATIMRPSIIFGIDDGFFNLFGALAAISPILPIVGKDTKFQPIFVGDVAKAICLAAEGKTKQGVIYELGGDEVENMHQLMGRVKKETKRNVFLLSVPFWFAKTKAFFLQILPSPLLTVDQVVQLSNDNIVSSEAKKQRRTLSGLGIDATSMDIVLPTYMWRFRQHGQFEKQET